MSTEAIRVVHVERVDDIPVLLAMMQRLQLAELFDRHYPAHHLWQGDLSPGEVLCVWLTFLLSEGDHRLYKLQPWAQQHLLTLQACLGKTVRALDFHDDRLADLLDALPRSEPWQAFEADLNRHTIRVYQLDPALFRIDTTTANSYAHVLSEHGLLQFGHSKGDPGRPQLKVAASALDPLGLPVTTAVVPGNSADDPLYVPQIQQVHASFGQGGKTFVGDCKMAALGTRAYLVSTGDFYLCPLSEKQMSQQERRQRLEPVWQGQQKLQPVYRPAASPEDKPELIAEGFGFDVALQAEVDGKPVQWTERRWLVRSVAFAQSQEQKLHKRLEAATQELSQLAQRKQGKKRLDAPGLLAAAAEVLARHRVVGLLQVEVQTQSREREVRGYRGKPARVEVEQQLHLEVQRNEGAITQAQREMGWQVYAVNQVQLPLLGVVLAYRGQYHIEGSWSRLKGKPLSLEPMHLKNEERMAGLVLLLMLAVRVLTLLEWQVREQLRQKEEKLKGIYPGQPGRQSSRPSAEMLLQAFKGISLTVIEGAGQRSVHLTPLTALQEKLLALWDFPRSIFQRLTTCDLTAELAQRLSALHCSKPPPALSER
jgi:transposase